jgi:hypothetical protein
MFIFGLQGRIRAHVKTAKRLHDGIGLPYSDNCSREGGLAAPNLFFRLLIYRF